MHFKLVGLTSTDRYFLRKRDIERLEADVSYNAEVKGRNSLLKLNVFLKISSFSRWKFNVSLYLRLVLGMTLPCIHIFIATGSFLYWCVMMPATMRFFIHSYINLRILIISYLATFLGTNSLSVPMCRKAVNQSVKPISAVCTVGKRKT